MLPGASPEQGLWVLPVSWDEVGVGLSVRCLSLSSPWLLRGEVSWVAVDPCRCVSVCTLLPVVSL